MAVFNGKWQQTGCDSREHIKEVLGDTWFDIMADKVKAAGDEFMKLEYHFDAGANAMRLKIGSFEKEQTKVLGQESIFSPADRPAPHLVKDKLHLDGDCLVWTLSGDNGEYKIRSSVCGDTLTMEICVDGKSFKRVFSRV